jgi:transposase
MASLSISQAAKTFKVSRSTIQRKIKSGDLSLDASRGSGAVNTKSVDISELVRVFGEPRTTVETVSMHASRDNVGQPHDTQENLIKQLRNENEWLRKELEEKRQQETLRITYKSKSWLKRIFG